MTPALTFHAQKARILAGQDRLTYGDFKAWIRVCGEEAAAARRDFAPRQRTVSDLFRVSFRTAKNWFRRAYRDGLLKPIVQRIQLADGTWRRIANKYVVARTIRFRLILARRWAQLTGSAASPADTAKPPARPPANPQKSAVSPYVQLFAPQNSAKSDYLPTPQQADAAPAPQLAEKRSFWLCSYDRCQTRNAWPVTWCRQCRSGKPFHAEKITE